MSANLIFRWIFIVLFVIDLGFTFGKVRATEGSKVQTCSGLLSNNNVLKWDPSRRKTNKPSDPVKPLRVVDFLAKLNELISEKEIFQTIERLPSSLIEAVGNLEDLLLEEQVKVLTDLESHGVSDVESVLRVLSIRRKASNSKYHETMESFVDPSVYKAMRGHRVEIVVEVPKQGVSRSQSDFFKFLIDNNMNIVGLDMRNNDIRRLQLEPGGIPLREVKKPEAQPSRSSVLSPEKGEDSSTSDNIVHITGLQGLLRLVNQNPNHPGLIYGEAVKEKMRSAMAVNYSYELMAGVVKDPPGYSNQGMLSLEDGRTLEMTNIRMLNIVGIDVRTFLDRGENEIYLGKKVRVWIQKLRKWVTGSVIVPDSLRGLVEVIADEVVFPNSDYHGGRGISVGAKSVDLDMRDPSIYPERIHPLQKYPQIELGKVLKFTNKDHVVDYGYIDDINTGGGYYRVIDSLGDWPEIRFEEEVQFLDLEVTPSEPTRVRREGRISVVDYPELWERGKERVYRILAYDPEDRIIVAKIVSTRPSGMESVRTFYLNDQRIYFVGNDNSEIFRLHPELSKAPEYGSRHMVEFYISPGVVRTGEVLTKKTLPVFIEVVIEKSRDQIGDDGDLFFRFNVRPSQIIRVWNPYK